MAAGVKIGLFKPLGEASFSEPCDLELVQAYRVLNLNSSSQKPTFVQILDNPDQIRLIKLLLSKLDKVRLGVTLSATIMYSE